MSACRDRAINERNDPGNVSGPQQASLAALESFQHEFMSRAVFPEPLPRWRREISGNCADRKALACHEQPDFLRLRKSAFPPLGKAARQEAPNIVGTVGSYCNTTCGDREIGASAVESACDVDQQHVMFHGE